MTRHSIFETDTFAVDAAGVSSIGQARATNQDQFLVASINDGRLHVRSTTLPHARSQSASPARATLLMVADGMGGARGGEDASRAALEAVAWRLAAAAPCTASSRDSLLGMRRQISSAVLQGQAAVERAAAMTRQPNMGTTLTAAYVTEDWLYLGHVGDSRCYLARGGQLVQLTADHTVAEQLRAAFGEEMHDASPYEHVLWKALTANRAADVEPQLERRRLYAGDVLLLCSDGLTKHVDDAELLACLLARESARATATRLVALANERGGLDNITAVVGRISEPRPSATATGGALPTVA